MTFAWLAASAWPSLYVTHYYYASGAIAIGLLMDWLAFRYFMPFSEARALVAALVVNGLSAVLLWLLLPSVGFLFDAGGGNAFWASREAAWLAAAVMMGLIEFVPLVLVFSAQTSWRLFGCVMGLNAATVVYAISASWFMGDVRL